MLKLDWGDAQIRMGMAEMLYLRNVGNPEEYPHRPTGYPRMNELNVAAVCAGYAFELLFKVLVKAGRDELPKAEHEPSKAYGDLTPKDKVEIDRIIVEHEWNDPADLLAFLDKDLCDKNRKYWMRLPRGGEAIIRRDREAGRIRLARRAFEPSGESHRDTYAAASRQERAPRG